MFKIASALAACAFSFLTPVQAADLTAGKAAFETCRGCHSAAHYNNAYPTYYVPKIGGQRKDYVVAALTGYREKQRSHGSMKANAGSLTDKAIENIGAYLETTKGTPAEAPYKGDPSLGKKLAQSCLGCHNKGKDGQSNVPILEGQYGNYLLKAMKDYQSGKRNNPLMQSMLKDLSEADLTNISAYFASQKALLTTE